jgi:modulator of FtsH protease
MTEAYQDFFLASVGASAAFIGLLFVALSFIDDEKTNEKVRNWQRIIASSSFAQLANIFFVSLAGLLPGVRYVALTGCVVAVLGIVISFRLLPQTTDSQRTGRRTPTVLGMAAAGVYVLEFVTSAWLLHWSGGQTVLDYFMLAIILLYAGALARAWEITGIKGH